MNKRLKSAGWVLIVIALYQSAGDLRGGLAGERAAPQYAVVEVTAR